MEEKLDQILKNQQIIYDKLIEILNLINKTNNSAFAQDYLANIAGTVTAEIGLADIVRSFKPKK